MMITLAEVQLDPYVTHGLSPRRPTGPGLPAASGVPACAAPHRDGLLSVADALGAPGGRPVGGPRDRLRTGELPGHGGTAAGRGLPGDAAGDIPTPYVRCDGPAPRDRAPLSPSLRALAGCAAAVDELADLRGQFASYVDRHGPQAAAEASRRLLAVFEEGDAGTEPAPPRRTAALIRPLAPGAGPGGRSGLTLDLPPRFLDEAFGAAAIVRFEEIDFPAALTHEPTRRFLRGAGLPEGGPWFSPDTDVPLPTLEEYRADDAPRSAPLPRGADRLVRLGRLAGGAGLVVDGATGAVLSWSEGESVPRPLNTDVSTLVFTLWLLHREKARDVEHELTDAYGRLADTMIRTWAAVDTLTRDPVVRATPTDDDRCSWPGMFEGRAGGGPCA
ncbi:SUKH-4 family immunity protein [Streptomyces sp. WG7]|uniref:SUKH-4 family immunity protein n=1 Tax=Streptomyces sp. WG7 TaxID=3417650 RepID=UPI003CF2001F